MAVTLRDVAARAGVSASAVSRVFTPGASVSARMREKVERAAADLGYRPSMLASALSTRRTKLIGLVSTNFQNPVFLEIFDRLTRALQARALRPLLVNLSDRMTLEAAVEMLWQYSVDGVILASSTLPPDFPLAFRKAGLPVVHAFGRWSPKPEVHVVGVDNREAGRLAAQTLLARGYRRIGFLGGPENATSTVDRLAGLLDGLADVSDAALMTGFAETYSFEAGQRTMQCLLEANMRPQAWFCGDDILSIGAMSALSAAGLRVPADVGVLGMNDMEMAGWPSVNLTTIRQPIDTIIETAVDLMVALLNNAEANPVARLFDCAVIERGTLRPVASSQSGR